MGYRIRTLSPDDPPDSFPVPAEIGVALGFPDGLVAIGGDLTVPRLLAAYRSGYFPWYNEDQPILWWSPSPRAVIFPSEFHMSRSLARSLNSGRWRYSLNHDFATTIASCAADRGEHGTWLSSEMQTAYMKLHSLGYAHSIESWSQGRLAGGIYGVRLGSVFFGESMFSSETDGSKVALAGLIRECVQEGIKLLDCQLASNHLRSLGMVEITRERFSSILSAHTAGHRPLPDWRFGPRAAGELAQLRALKPQ